MDHLFPVQHAYLIPLLPLIGAAIAGFFGARWLRGRSHWPIWLGVGASAILSIALLFGMLGLTDHHAPAAAHAGEGAAATAPAHDAVEPGAMVSAGAPRDTDEMFVA